MKVPQRKHIEDAVFLSVVLAKQPYSYVGEHDSAASSTTCTPRDFLCYPQRPAINLERMVCIGKFSDPTATFLCPTPHFDVPTYSPFAIYDMQLMELRHFGAVDAYGSLEDMIANGTQPDWCIVERPVLRGLVTPGNFVFNNALIRDMPQVQQHEYLSFYQNHIGFPVLDRLGARIETADGTNCIPSVEEFPELQAVSTAVCYARRPQWLRLCASLSPEVCAGISMREQKAQVVDRYVEHMERLASTEPWRLFVGGLLDTRGLLLRLEQHDGATLAQLRQTLYDLLPDVDPTSSLFWQSVANIYTHSACAYGPSCAYTVPQQSLAEALCRLGLMCRRSNDGALVNRAVVTACDWLVRYVVLLQRIRPVAAGLATPNNYSEVHQALVHRDVLLVETELPLNSPVVRARMMRNMRDAALVCLSPVSPPHSVSELQRVFTERMSEIVQRKPDCMRFPMVVIEDAQWWSAHALQFWLTALHTAPQIGDGFKRDRDGRYASTGSAAPFKLVVCYSMAVEDSGVRDVLLDAVSLHYIRSCSADGCPPNTRGTLPPRRTETTEQVVETEQSAEANENSRASLLRRISSVLSGTAATVSEETAKLLYAILRSDTQATESAVAFISRAAMSPDMFVVKSVMECAVQQMASAGVLPVALIGQNARAYADSPYSVRSVVAMEMPIDKRRLTTLLCLMDRVLIVEEE